jgi:hypothetical protein
VPLRSSAESAEGEGAGASVKEVTSITLGIPDPALFDIPESYVEMSPSAVEGAHSASLGKPIPPAMLESMQRHDRSYYNELKNKP